MIPKDKKLYEKVKKEIFKKYPKNSAYRSGLLVKTYKEKLAHMRISLCLMRRKSV